MKVIVKQEIQMGKCEKKIRDKFRNVHLSKMDIISIFFRDHLLSNFCPNSLMVSVALSAAFPIAA